ncbi:sensor histidine kinase TmoS [Clostridium tepidiprofundi DSM 19306]|uniref:histidine kinase n=1 Tax=Clostridium tepidiprofundi DSM 19306 TaxID=1121338 RepID=A0A151B6C9_9CLOT|nr:PAS domain-containing sensor histidine kinase [Clostridium tepidiprofundi]KYH35444.1 sensor histidine kinase TmoS [Clostridium tepidiprofundi DSM 19306]
MVNYGALKENEKFITDEVLESLLYDSDKKHLKESITFADFIAELVKYTVLKINDIVIGYDEYGGNDNDYNEILRGMFKLCYTISSSIEHDSLVKIEKIFKNAYLKFVDMLVKQTEKYEFLLRVDKVFDNIEMINHDALLKELEHDLLDSSDKEYNKLESSMHENFVIYSNLLELIPDSLVLLNNNCIVYANKAAAELLGASKPSDIVGKRVSDFLVLSAYDVALIEQENDILYRNGVVPVIEKRYIRKSDNKEIIIETKHALVPYKGEKVVLNVSRDISERKKIQVLKEKIKEKTLLLEKSKEYDKAKTEFFTNISHELRTPLNVILGIIQLVEKKSNGSYEFNQGKISSYIRTLKHNCYRLLRLVNNLIDITKIDAGYLSMNFGKYNLVNVIENITLSVVGYSESKGINLIFDTNVEEKYMCVDPDKIERIVLNLLSNAIKFTEAGDEIRVTFTDLGDKVRISVKDTGIGIPKDKQDKIFERFVQVDKSLSRKNEGSGIGLSMVKAFVEMHAGTIEVNSEYGNGSEFIIELPVREFESKIICKDKAYDEYANVEKINIEFSDIYID